MNEFPHYPAARLVSTCREIAARRLDRLDEFAPQTTQLYWRDPEAHYEFRGLGAAAVLYGATAQRFAQIESQIGQLFAEAHMPDPPLGPRLAGGFAFTHQYLSDRVWQAFEPACFVLPHFQMERRDDRFFVTLNVWMDHQDSLSSVQRHSEEALSRFIEELSAQALPTESDEADADLDVHEPVSKGQWTRAVEKILALIQAGSVRKVVLAQARELRSAQGFNLAKASRILRRTYPECYAFFFQNGQDSAFLGASPELLCAVQGPHLSSMALAGTCPRDADPERDRANRQALHRSSKHRHEHRIVVDDITDTLERHGARVTCIPATGILSLHNVHHLCTPLQAACQEPRSALAWAALLHPTTALGGEPRDAALSLIEELEGAPRGWYGAPFGIVDSQLNGTFTTAIRSGVFHDKRAWIFAGAGIVAGSDPHLEWLETGWKFQPLQQALTA